MEQFKIRASSCSKLMGVKGLGLTGQSYLESWLKEYLYKRRKDIKSKYLTKGNECEEDGFTLMALQLNLGMVYKNTEYYETDGICGTPDLIINDTVYDNKCSWDLDTFPMFEKEIPNKDYWYQLQCYMELTGCRKAKLIYTLIDASYELVLQAVKWINNPEDIYRTICNMVYTKENFDKYFDSLCPLATSNYFIEIPESDRIKTFAFDYEKEAIDKIKGRVLESRIYLNNLINNK